MSHLKKIECFLGSIHTSSRLQRAKYAKETVRCKRVTMLTELVASSEEIPSIYPNSFRVPTRTGKPGKMGRHFPVREKSGKITQNTGKLREFEINII